MKDLQISHAPKEDPQIATHQYMFMISLFGEFGGKASDNIESAFARVKITCH